MIEVKLSYEDYSSVQILLSHIWARGSAMSDSIEDMILDECDLLIWFDSF